MQTFNHLYSSEKRLLSFVLRQGLDTQSQVFIQVFMGNNDPKAVKETLTSIKNILPHSSIIATSTAGEIVEGGMQDASTVVSITQFEATEVKVSLIDGNSESDMVETISAMLTSRSKLLIAFNNVYANDGEKILSSLEKNHPELMIAGGNAGDNGNFELQTVVGVNEQVSTSALAVALFDSDILKVFNDYLFNWQTIGESMRVTKSKDSTVYEIDNKSAQDVYRKFLGDEVADSLPGSGVEFPLIFNEGGFDIARAPVAIGEDGELVMAGHIKEGAIVRFGFGDVSSNAKNAQQSVSEFSKLPIESIFIYSCSARKFFLNERLNDEFELLQKIAPTAGFVTYGEFFKKGQCNKLLNVSSTFIGLSEDETIKHDIDFSVSTTSNQTRTLNALTHLVKQTSIHIEEKNLKLTQFQDLVKDSTLYSKTDVKGVITDVNDGFIELSGYSESELLGKPHNLVRHPDMPKETYAEMWKTIQSKKSWHGIVKNRAKDGSEYYVRSHIFPILDAENNIIEYISLRDDITAERADQKRLLGDVNSLVETNSEKEFLLSQYQKIMDLSSAFFRVDKYFKISYANDVFCNIYGCSTEIIQEKGFAELFEKEFFDEKFESTKEYVIEKGSWKGIIPLQRDDKSIVHMDTTITTVYDERKNVVEYMVVQNDITDVLVAQEEILSTQRDVVYTMGAIGETRSQETGNHVKRVAEYSKQLALFYGLSSEKAELLKMASPMHDIGKIAIPDAILNKPGKLTDEEFKIMKTHSALGYKMLKNSKREILKTAAIVAYTHHEKWEGGGYPKGIAGEDIDITGRITAIADVFDALGSDRCYKKAWKDEDIFALIKKEKAKHFDPKLVDIFFENLDVFLEIRDTFKD